MKKKFILYLIRKHLGVKKYQKFRFENQANKTTYYYFNDIEVMKVYENGFSERSRVSLNWLLNDECEITTID